MGRKRLPQGGRVRGRRPASGDRRPPPRAGIPQRVPRNGSLATGLSRQDLCDGKKGTILPKARRTAGIPPFLTAVDTAKTDTGSDGTMPGSGIC